MQRYIGLDVRAASSTLAVIPQAGKHLRTAVVAGVRKKRGQKSDQIDAWDLAERLLTGTLEKRIFKAPCQFGMLRELARTHMAIAHDLVRVQARLKSVYRSRDPDPGPGRLRPRVGGISGDIWV